MKPSRSKARRCVLRRLAEDESGVSLLNLLAAITVAAIVGALGIPQLAILTKGFDRFNSRSFLIQDLKLAQAHSVTEGCRGIVKIAANGESYVFGCDYLGYDPAAEPSPDNTVFTRLLPDHITVVASAPVIFDSRGQSVDIDGIVQNVTLQLRARTETFASGTLLGTGVFSYE
jgi:type II secretory pathway pseudopilin PulG